MKNSPSKPQAMYMVFGGAGPAPYWGIAFSRKDLLQKIRKCSCPPPRTTHRIKRIIVSEAP